MPDPGQILSPVAPIVRRTLRRTDGTTTDVGDVPGTGFAGTNARVVMFGKQLGEDQMRNADKALTVAASEKASLAATLALCMACIQEPAHRDQSKYPFGNPPFGHSTSVGILQLLDLHYGGSVKARMDVERVCRQFLRTGFYKYGGAMAIARHNRGIGAHEIAARVQGNQRGAVDYLPHRKLAEDLIRTWQTATKRNVWDVGTGKVPRPSAGGTARTTSSSSTTETTQTLKRLHRPTEWRRGQSGKPESSWTMLNRYAESFGRRRFVSEDRLVVADDDQLIRAAPHMSFAVTDPNILTRPSIEIDGPGGLETLQLTAITAWWTAPPGGVVHVQGGGPADGPWLVGTLRDSAGSPTVEVELMQPATEDPDRQTRKVRTTTITNNPVSDEASTPGSTAPGSNSGRRAVERSYREALRISARGLPYGVGGHGQNWAAARNASSYDCSSYTSMCLRAAGLMNNASGPQVSDWFLNWGKPGRGQNQTIWVKRGTGSAGHVFIEYTGIGQYRRADTNYLYAGEQRGPRVRHRAPGNDYIGTGTYTPRHWPGT